MEIIIDSGIEYIHKVKPMNEYKKGQKLWVANDYFKPMKVEFSEWELVVDTAYITNFPNDEYRRLSGKIVLMAKVYACKGKLLYYLVNDLFETKEQAQEEYLRKHSGFKSRIEEFGVEYVKNKR